MRALFLSALLFIATPAFSPAWADIEVGKPAPDFTGTTSDGKTIKLSELKGQPVVLEWTNNECPFVHKHYDSGNMQKLQQEATADKVIWLSIISSAPGKQGNVDGPAANKLTADRNAHPTAVILDPTGEIGHLYNATTTPHMFVIDKNGILVYAGGIDDKPTPVAASLEGANNYVRAALGDLKAGKPVATSHSKPYGCGIKYAN